MTTIKDFTFADNFKTKVLFISAGSDTPEETSGGSFTKYVGVAPFNFVALNPTLDEIKEFIPTYQGKEPEYLVESDGVKGIRLNFWWKIVKDHSSTEELLKDVEGDLYFNTSMLLMNNERVSAAGTSVQVINQYGETAWISPELAAKGELPLWAMKNEYQTPYRPCLNNEDILMDLIKQFLVIPITKKYVDGAYLLKDAKELENCRAQLSTANLAAIFTGDVSSIKNAMLSKKDNKIKLFMAVRKTDDNREYQEVLLRYPISFKTGKFDRMHKDIKEAVNAGAFSNIDFGGDITSDNYSFDFRVYENKPTDLKMSGSESDKMPWD